jgi:four helix bundle protein
MKYANFEDVPVWKDGITLSTKVFEITKDKAFRFMGDIANQIERAGLSIPNNIAEGFERGTTPELIMFLYYAKGSAGEVRSILHVMDRLPAFAHLKSEISDLKSLATSISRQLAAWAQSLQETDIRGPRHLTGQSKETWHEKKRATEFMERIKKEHEERIEKMVKERKAKTDGNPKSEI